MYEPPLVEKYRPNKLKTTGLINTNKLFINNILEQNKIPNILLYGPPGTGKTTTIINVINEYLKKNNISNKGLILHYNASDDRGIDIIRKTIYDFIYSKGLLSNGTKFVVLDEVDYMMANAQKHLKKIIESQDNIVYCLICNYISKIIPSLLSEFIILEYNNLYNNVDILKNIVTQENLNYTTKELENISSFYSTDIRSMINYLYHNSNTIFNDNIYQDIVLHLNTNDIKYLILKYSYELNISPLKLVHLCLNKYIKQVPLEYNFILFIEKVFIYDAELDYILYWWKHYNTEHNVY
tara:strand:- start:2687 stop:3574 length:888 start_codon:yes stop_codon:yes gene_type:complete